MRVRLHRPVVLGTILLGLGGCVVEGALDARGGGTLALHYRLVSVANLDQMKARLASPDVTLLGAGMTPDKQATFTLAMRDVRALSTVPAFADFHVTLTDDAEGLRTLSVVREGERVTLPAPYVAYLGGVLRVTLTLPGEVVRSNATAVTGRTASWERSLAAIDGDAPLVFSATYRPDAS